MGLCHNLGNYPQNCSSINTADFTWFYTFRTQILPIEQQSCPHTCQAAMNLMNRPVAQLCEMKTWSLWVVSWQPCRITAELMQGSMKFACPSFSKNQNMPRTQAPQDRKPSPYLDICGVWENEKYRAAINACIYVVYIYIYIYILSPSKPVFFSGVRGKTEFWLVKPGFAFFLLQIVAGCCSRRSTRYVEVVGRYVLLFRRDCSISTVRPFRASMFFFK